MNVSVKRTFVERYRTQNPRSEALYGRAKGSLPGGSTRGAAFFRPFPLYAAGGAGCRLRDVDGNERLDFMNNYSALVFGHAHPGIGAAVQEQVARSSVYGAPGEGEVELAELIAERVPSVEQVIFTSTGSEAVLAALRAARALTGRHLIGKFEGGYHGSYDWTKVSSKPDPAQAGPPERPQAVPDSGGIPAHVLDDVRVMRFNDPESVEATLERWGDEMAAVIVEPVLGSGGMIPPEPPFLERLREATTRHGTLLIFDEIITQRLEPGGAQGRYGVHPDLTLLAKGIGGGFPIGAVGGPRELMGVFDNSELKPRVYHSGTFNANALSVAAGLATLRALTPAVCDRLHDLGERCRQGLAELFDRTGAPVRVSGVGSLFNFHATREPLRDYRSVRTSDSQLQHELFLGMVSAGIYLAPRGMGCISVPMREAEVDAFVDAMKGVLADLGFGG